MEGLLIQQVENLCIQNGNKPTMWTVISNQLDPTFQDYVQKTHGKFFNFLKKYPDRFKITQDGRLSLKDDSSTKSNVVESEVINGQPSDVTKEEKWLQTIIKCAPVNQKDLGGFFEGWISPNEKKELISSHGSLLKFVLANPKIFKHSSLKGKSSNSCELNGILRTKEFKLVSKNELDATLYNFEFKGRYFQEVSTKMKPTPQTPSKEPKKPKEEKYIYSIDFELAWKDGDYYLPNEIGCVKMDIKTGKIVDKFHEFIYTAGVPSDYISKMSPKIHGLFYEDLPKLAKKNVSAIWKEFLKFIDYENTNPILFAKGKETEISCLKWMARNISKIEFDVLDLHQVIRIYEPKMTEEEAKYAELRALRYLNREEKCKHHQTLNQHFHCALEDACANAYFIQDGISKSFYSFLVQEQYIRPKLSDDDVKYEKFKIEIETSDSVTLKIDKIVIDEKEVWELLQILPEKYFDFFSDQDLMELIDIEMDFNRIPKAHFLNGPPKRISEDVVTRDDIEHVTKYLKVLPNNRSGIDKFLHRISVIRGMDDSINGITLRVGKSIIGNSSMVSDILDEKKSILFLGPPGTGKTSKKIKSFNLLNKGIIRDIARYISETTRTIIVDSSSEISGFGDTPHSSIGEARVMKIPEGKNQEKIMIEAIQNHTPEALIIDEIGTQFEVFATKECSQRGIIMYASAHGTVKNLEKNQTIVGLVGGIESVIMGDRALQNQATGSKDKVQRRLKYKPLFDVIVELKKENRNEWVIYRDVERLMNNMLAGRDYEKEIRTYYPEKSEYVKKKEMDNNSLL